MPRPLRPRYPYSTVQAVEDETLRAYWVLTQLRDLRRALRDPAAQAHLRELEGQQQAVWEFLRDMRTRMQEE